MTIGICPSKGEMDKCKKKPRCKWGACDGQSLPSDPDDYCPSGYVFRPDYCDCEPRSRYWDFTATETRVQFIGSGCCQGWNSPGTRAVATYRDVGFNATLESYQSWGISKRGYTNADGDYIYCRSSQTLMVSDVFDVDYYWVFGPFGSYGGATRADETVLFNNSPGGYSQNLYAIMKWIDSELTLLVPIFSGLTGAVNCVTPGVFTNVVGTPRT